MQSTTNSLPANAIVKYMGGNIFLYWFLSFISCGLYFYFFQSKFNGLSRKLNMEIGNRRLGAYFVLSLLLRIAGVMVPFVMAGVATVDENGAGEVSTLASILVGLSPLMFLVGILFEVMWSYRARHSLRMYVFMNYRVTLDVNRFLLFFFPGYTLTMAISHIEGEIAVAGNAKPEHML